ncbi:phosphoglycerate dehydrogenase-like enzyme [Haloactinopolyspora alba]|uniref:Phosphoglycerate dehydrogenase-like enzyme n=1 Tax=Haloactinopolyspora alba TaxID=648780 RepID=A0A2P8EGF8_9ACTN|nr:hydroxyacid dehydrogenase [Haloactinopolyspora alba]PSL08540.1 phosphoglycerate dehydrogenase-like enzyme [Haloactinopolyspora alba]
MDTRPVAALAMARDLPTRLFDDDRRARLAELVDLHDTVLTEFGSPDARAVLRDTEVLVTGWGAPPVDADALAHAPRLRAVVHTAGTIKHLIHAECWERGIRVTTAANANGVPVAEYTLAMIMLAGKDAFAAARRYQHARGWDYSDAVGNYRRTVGVVGASRVGRHLLRMLQPFDFDVLLSDPYVDAGEARRLGATRRDLDETLAASSIVTLHAPSTPQTRHMIDKRRLALLPDGATLINTARGAVVDEDALVTELTTGRIGAVLDVTDPEPAAPDSPLRTLPNVVLTPHIAGSLGNEVARLGDAAIAEIGRYRAGESFAEEVDAARLNSTA